MIIPLFERITHGVNAVDVESSVNPTIICLSVVFTTEYDVMPFNPFTHITRSDDILPKVIVGAVRIFVGKSNVIFAVSVVFM